MQYSDILLDVDVNKLADRSNCENLILKDGNNRKALYRQVVVVMLDDKLRCVLRAKYDDDFGEYYYVGKMGEQDVLLIEKDNDIKEKINKFYIMNANVIKRVIPPRDGDFER